MKWKYVFLFGIAFVLTFLLSFYFSFQNNKPEDKHNDAMEALQYWAMQRAYPNTMLPDAKYVEAFKRSQKQFALKKNAGTDSWQSLGPHNIGGRTLALSFNPQNAKTLYAGSASGGLWRSYSAGIGAQAWQHVSTGFPVLGVNAIAISLKDSNTIFIGTGEVYGYQNSIGGLGIRTTRGSYGIGILKTTNNGVTWKKSLDWSYTDERGVQAIKIHSAFSHYVWAATSEGTYKSTDAGSTWKLSHTVLMATDIALHPTDTNIVFIACGNLSSPEKGIYRSTDAGVSWTKLSNGLPTSTNGKIFLTMYPSSPNVLFASIGAGSVSGTWLCKTTDNGDTWKIISTLDYASYQGWYSHFVGVHPTDSSKILCGGIDLWKSVNGGTTFTQKSYWYKWFLGTTLPGTPEGPADYSHADHHAIVYNPNDPNIMYFGNDGGVFRTTDGGETFSGCNGGYQTGQFYNGFSSAFTDSSLAIGGLQDNATAIFEGTDAWRRVIGGDGCVTAIDPTNPNIMFGAYQYLNILKSTDRGNSWINLSVPYSANTNFMAPYLLAPSHSNIMYAGNDKIYKSIDGGRSWSATNNNQVLDGNPALAIAVSQSNPDTVYAATAPISKRAGIFRSTNGGGTWFNITDTLPDRFPVDVMVDPNNSATVYVTFSGFGTAHVFKSTNAGTNWKSISVNLPDVPTSAIIVDPKFPDNIYIGNDLGVFVSTNGGTQWQQFSDGLIDATIVMDLSISRTNRKLRAVTHGNGVYERALIETTTGIHEKSPNIVSDFRLEQNFPNPFNPATVINYQLPITGKVSLKIYDLLGKEIVTLVDERQSAGTYNYQLSTSNYQLASGVYFYQLQAGNYVATKKMLLLK